MKHVRLLLGLGLVLLPVLCRAGEGDYGYPIPGSYAATIMGTPEELAVKKPKDLLMKELVLEIHPERKKPDIFYYDEGLV